ncbi:MAG: efflux RND transporter permease subunit, partial [Crocinitomicaceae bacterium]|nr:efflux RND transporter permease subunit [Crocinitomicaceae bacterium]
QKFYIDKMGYEMAFFMVLSYLLVIVFLFIAFRSLWGVLMPQLVILGTLFWVVGFIGLYGEPVSIVMSVLPCIVFVVAMSDVIHLLSRYLDAFRTGIGKFASIKLTIREVGMATFLTSVTTAIGFFSLMFISVQPIQVFGAIAGFGVLIAFVLTFVLLPIIIYVAPNPTFLKKSDRDPFWKKKLSKWFIRVLRQPKRISIVYVGFIAVCLIGMVNLEANNFLMDEISQKEPIKQNFNFLDEHYGGIRPFELSISLKDTSKTFWSLEVLKDVEKVENYIETVYGAGLRSSIVKVVKVMNRSTHTGRVDYFTLPERERDLKRFKRGLEKVSGGQFKNVLLDSTGHFARLSGNMPDWGNKVISKKNEAFQQFLKKEMSNSTIKVQLTGTAHLLDKNISYLSLSLIKGISLSVILVALIMGLLYRSVSMVLISIIPNLIPLIFVAAIMGYFGINIKTSTAIVFTIAFGIAVDDTIHFLGKFKYELMKGRSKMYALKRSFLTTGKAMIITTFILCAGFILLVFSSFLGTAIMGVLLCLTLFLALIVDLTLLPVLLMLFYKVKK